MIGRLFEDLIFLVRLIWFYYRAPLIARSIGFTATNLTKRQRLAFAYKKAQWPKV